MDSMGEREINKGWTVLIEKPAAFDMRITIPRTELTVYNYLLKFCLRRGW